MAMQVRLTVHDEGFPERGQIRIGTVDNGVHLVLTSVCCTVCRCDLVLVLLLLLLAATGRGAVCHICFDVGIGADEKGYEFILADYASLLLAQPVDKFLYFTLLSDIYTQIVVRLARL